MSRRPADVERVLSDFIISQFFSGDADRMPAHDEKLVGPFIDSIGLHRIVAFIEAEFSLSVEDKELTLDNFSTLVGMVTFVETKLSRAND